MINTAGINPCYIDGMYSSQITRIKYSFVPYVVKDIMTAEHEGFSWNEPKYVYFDGKKVN